MPECNEIMSGNVDGNFDCKFHVYTYVNMLCLKFLIMMVKDDSPVEYTRVSSFNLQLCMVRDPPTPKRLLFPYS